MRFPRQDIPTIEKTPDWYGQVLNFGQDLLRTYSTSRSRMDLLYGTFNGTRKPDSIKWLTNTYGKANRVPYESYKLSRTKINLLVGEQLKRPLSATVTTINSSAMSDKMRQFNMMKGAMVAKQELEDVRDKVGIDVMEGVPIPENEDDPIFKKMSFKDKSEDIMQIILDNAIKELNIKKFGGDLIKDVLIASMCWSKKEIDENGDIKIYRIDPRDAIYELIEGDDYFDRSTVKGARQTMTVEEILNRYDLTKDQRDQLDAVRGNPGYWANRYPQYIFWTNNQLSVSIIHLEWKGYNIDYIKEIQKKPSEFTIEGREGSSVEIPLDARGYEKDKAKYDKREEKGDFKINKKYREEWYEATRIGGIIDVNCRPKPFQTRDMDNPAYVLNCSYNGFTLPVVDGCRMSLQEEMQKFDMLFDIVMYQINKELARAKGKIITFDRAALSNGQKFEDVIYRAANDQFLDYNSAAAGNLYGKSIDPANMFKEIDLGVSSAFQYLIVMQSNIINMLNQITGINESREGNIAASSTATNATAAIQNSRTITEAIFYGMNIFTQKFLQDITNLSAISWAFYKTEKGEQILGSDRFNFLKVTQAEGYKNYGVFIDNGSEYMDAKQIMKEMVSYSLNAKEIRPLDAFKVLTAETKAQMDAAFKQSWAEMEASRQQAAQVQGQQQAQMSQSQQQNQYQMHQEDLMQTEKNNKEDIVLKGQVQMAIDNNKTSGKLFEQNQKQTAELLNQQQQQS